ncbi:MAG: ABC transporter ATP-binding protein [bacterium]|nr:ABC transporter ATP-binding protein [bacterium]
MSYAVETTNLTRTFGELTAVDALDLKVARGTFFGFLGPNGAGKSTTMKMLTGLLDKTSGEARILGHDLERDALEVKRRIGVVPEELALYERLKGREYLTFVGRMYGLARADTEARAGELLELMELDRSEDKLIVDYSHGMKKKLALSAALIHKPELLFLDEPFEGLDAIAARLIKDLMGSLIRSGVTIFLTSHILEIVEKLCSDIAIIHRGRLVAQGTLAELRSGIPGQAGATLEQLFLSLVDAEEAPAGHLSWLG